MYVFLHYVERCHCTILLLLQVNELNDTVENLQDEIGAMKTEIQRFQDDDVKFEEQRIAMIKEMEVNACFHG